MSYTPQNNLRKERRISSAPSAPAQVQMQQQITVDEVDVVASDALSTAGVAGSVSRLFDKDLANTVVIAAGAQSITIVFESPILVTRALLAALAAAPIDQISIAVVQPDGTTTTWVASSSGSALDSLNQTPIYASQVVLTQNVASGGGTLTQLVIQKMIETKGEVSRIEETTQIIFEQLVQNPVPRGPGGVAFVTPASLNGLGINIERYDNLAINVELDIEDIDAAGVITIQVDFYYSDDNMNFHYFLSIPITIIAGVDGFGNPNKHGFVAPGDTARAQISHAFIAFSRFIAPVVANNDAVNRFGVSANLIAQR